MKTTIDTYTGKAFRYDPELPVRVGEYNTVARYSRGFLLPLHPDRLTPEKFAELNPEAS